MNLSRRTYISLMALVESFKHSGRKSNYKPIRAFRYYKYLALSVVANWLISRVKAPCLSPAADRTESITASLTTFPDRINQVRYAILSIMLQSVAPDRVVLWLAEEQFPDHSIPEDLKDLCKRGLEVRFCENLRSHKKYYHALKEQKERELVITFDDDIIYHPDTIGRLLRMHKKHPGSIVASQMHVMTFDSKGAIEPYDHWHSFTSAMPNPNKDFMPLTGSGCLYPHGVMPEVTFDETKIRDLAFTADDLWIGFIARYYHIPLCIVNRPAKVFSVVASSQTVHLGQINCLGDGNDRTVRNLVNAFSQK